MEEKQNNQNKENIEFYPCKTPVDEEGDILFNDNRQVLFYSNGLYDVVSTESYWEDCKQEFVWIPCKREEMIAGDIVYAKHDENETFDKPYRVCKIINNTQHVKVFDDKDISVSIDFDYGHYNYWYKLVRKKDLK